MGLSREGLPIGLQAIGPYLEDLTPIRFAALLVREMRENTGLTQAELAKKVGTTQSVIARLEDVEYTGHSLTMLERIAAACGVAIKLRAEKRPDFEREVAWV